MALRACRPAAHVPALAVLATLFASCGPESREVLAHHGDGTVHSQSREVRSDRGAWIRNGPFRGFHANGALESEGAYRDGLEDGPWTYWLPNGEKSSAGSWSRGAREGRWTYYHDGVRPLAAGSFHRDLEQGRWTTWYASGALESEGAYVAGRKEGVWLHRFPDGSIDEVQTGVYEAGRRIEPWIVEGRRTREFPSGATKEIAELRNGVLHGPFTGFHEDGRKAAEGRYVLGHRTGPWTFWAADGEVDASRTGEYFLSSKREN